MQQLAVARLLENNAKLAATRLLEKNAKLDVAKLLEKNAKLAGAKLLEKKPTCEITVPHIRQMDAMALARPCPRFVNICST